MVTELRSVSYGKTWFYSKCNGKPLVDLKQKKDTVQFFLLKQSLWQLCIEQTGRGEVRSLWKSQDMMMASREDRNALIQVSSRGSICCWLGSMGWTKGKTRERVIDVRSFTQDENDWERETFPLFAGFSGDIQKSMLKYVKRAISRSQPDTWTCKLRGRQVRTGDLYRLISM